MLKSAQKFANFIFIVKFTPFVSLNSPPLANTSGSATDPRREGQTELTWMVCYTQSSVTHRQTVTDPSTNRARRRATTLIETNALRYH